MNERDKKLFALQEEKRQYRLAEIDDAIDELLKSNSKITIAMIAEEMGITRQAMRAPFIVEHLQNHPAIKQSSAIDDSQQLQIVRKENEKLKSEVERLKQKSKKLEFAKTKFDLELKQITERYQRLLGEYQKKVSNKSIHL